MLSKLEYYSSKAMTWMIKQIQACFGLYKRNVIATLGIGYRHLPLGTKTRPFLLYIYVISKIALQVFYKVNFPFL